MIENYYEILELKFNAEIFSIAKHYKILANKYLNLGISTNDSIQKVYQICRAVEILKDEQVRKYYNILYHIFILATPSEISEERIQQYLSIIETYIEKGDARAEKIINQPYSEFSMSVRKRLLTQYIQAALCLYIPNTKLRTPLFFIPLAGFVYIIIALLTFLRVFDVYWALGSLWLTLGCIIHIAGFRQFIIDSIYKE